MPDKETLKTMTPVEIMEVVNDLLGYLCNEGKVGIYDEENPSCFLTGTYYNKVEDKLYFACGEE